MANNRPGRNHDVLKNKILFVAAKHFLEQGYTNTTMKVVAASTGLSSGSITNLFSTKEDILCGLVRYVIDAQFDTAEKMLSELTDDKLMLYAAETVLQLHIVEMDENLRELYSLAYSLPKPSALLQETVTAELERIFKDHLPSYETKDFYMLEIATGGIMRGFMTVPCNMWFTMDMKIEAFLRNVLRLYYIPEDRINEAIAFVNKFDFKCIAKQTIDSLMEFLEQNLDSAVNFETEAK